MTEAEKAFCNKLETVSGVLADWARAMIKNYSWSIEDCRTHLTNAAKAAGKSV